MNARPAPVVANLSLFHFRLKNPPTANRFLHTLSRYAIIITTLGGHKVRARRNQFDSIYIFDKLRPFVGNIIAASGECGENRRI